MLNEINKLIFAASYENPSLNKFYLDDLDNPQLKEVFKSCSIALDLALNKNILLYRGVSKSTHQRLSEIVSVNPGASSREREPLAASPSMMYLYKNLPFFRGWPDRYRSIFFTNNYAEAAGFSDFGINIFLIFPYNTSKIARVWNDFNYPANLLPIFSNCLYDIDQRLMWYLKSNGLIKMPENSTRQSVISEIKKNLKLFNNDNVKILYDKFLRIAKDAEDEGSDSGQELAEIMYAIISRAFKLKTYNSTAFFNEILSVFDDSLTSSNQYELINTASLAKDYAKDLEYWTDEPCLMIEYEYFKKDINEIRKIYDSL